MMTQEEFFSRLASGEQYADLIREASLRMIAEESGTDYDQMVAESARMVEQPQAPQHDLRGLAYQMARRQSGARTERMSEHGMNAGITPAGGSSV